MDENIHVSYEAFGAVGDGMADDLPAICEAHAYANSHGLAVRSHPEATYHLGRRALTAVIATPTDWNTSRFFIDDTEVDDHRAPLFQVSSLLEPYPLALNSLSRDQKQLEMRPSQACHVMVEDDRTRLYRRRGLNQSLGEPKQDCFILRQDGSVEGDIDWDYDGFSRVIARPIDDKTLTLKGGVFTTFANAMKQEVGYNYWARNIEIHRSNTTVDGLTHYVVGETSVGHPYRGFLSATQCADVTFRNCFVTGHKIYSTIGNAGMPVKMGSYDIHAAHIVNLQLFNCRMNHICDATRWGVIASNFCKNILLEDCTLSRMDTHMGVSGSYIVRRCTLGHAGLNAIGRGRLSVEDSTLYGHTLVSFRDDYGSTWEGELFIHNCRWIPACSKTCSLYMFSVHNDGTHDFGYPCSMPQAIIIEGLLVDDANHPDDYGGIYFFTDPDDTKLRDDDTTLSANRPFPYEVCQTLSVSGLTTASKKQARISPNPALEKSMAVLFPDTPRDDRL